MKRLLSLATLLLSCIIALAQDPFSYTFVEASDLTVVGKLMPGKTANPYHRVDTSLYQGLTQREQRLVMESSGMACAFKTNSKRIVVKTEYARRDEVLNGNMITARGYDLYIKQDGKWLWAGSGTNPGSKLDQPARIVTNMDGTEHECLLYFPLYSEEKSIKIGVIQGSTIEAIPYPFRHRIAVWGSSYTHGSSTTRAGMTYPAQLSRNTGLHLLSLGMSGNCKLQESFSAILSDVDADAFLFDTFSNPTPEEIEERLIPFVNRMIKAHPGKPLIFQQTIYRETRHFNKVEDRREQEKMDTAEKILKHIIGKPKYKDVYFIYPETNTDGSDNTVDGVHPDNHGYKIWAESIEKPILDILSKYGIN